MTLITVTGNNLMRNRFLRVIPVFAVLVFSLFFTSCFSVGTEFSIKKTGASTALLTYTIDKEFISFWEGEEGSGYLLFPISKRDFQQRTLQVDGASLLSYRIANKNIDNNEMQIIRAEISFESPEALNLFFNGEFTLDITDDKGSFNYSLYNSGKKISSEVLARVLDLVGDSDVSVTVNAPAVITQQSNNSESKNSKKDQYSVKIADLLTGDAQSNITVKW